MLGEGGPQLTSHRRSTGVAPLPPLKEDFDVNTPNLKEDFDVNAHSEEGGKSFGFAFPGGRFAAKPAPYILWLVNLMYPPEIRV